MNRANWQKRVLLSLLDVCVAFLLIGSVMEAVQKHRLSEQAAA